MWCALHVRIVRLACCVMCALCALHVCGPCVLRVVIDCVLSSFSVCSLCVDIACDPSVASVPLSPPNRALVASAECAGPASGARRAQQRHRRLPHTGERDAARFRSLSGAEAIAAGAQ